MPTVASPSLEKQTPTLFPVRLAAVAGLAAAVVLFLNAAKRAGLIPVSSATQLAAPLAQALAIILIVGQPPLRCTNHQSFPRSPSR